MTVCRGIRGATIAEENTADGIYSATKELLDGLIEGNNIIEGEVAAVYFTMTPDLNAVSRRRWPAKRDGTTQP